MKWGNIRDGCIEIEYGKTDNARRRIPLSQRVTAVLAMRSTDAKSEWVFPAPTRSGHIEPGSLKATALARLRGEAEPLSKTSGARMARPKNGTSNRSRSTRSATRASRVGRRTWILGRLRTSPATAICR
jgi:hypothetical protein